MVTVAGSSKYWCRLARNLSVAIFVTISIDFLLGFLLANSLISYVMFSTGLDIVWFSLLMAGVFLLYIGTKNRIEKPVT